MSSNLYVATTPATEPLTVAEAREFCRVDAPEENALLERLIVSARQWGEAATDRAFITQSWELKLSSFPGCAIELPRPPLISVTSIKYLDTAAVEQTWAGANYIVTGAGDADRRGRIEPAYGISYPSSHPVPDAVRIVFVAGYGAAGAVPQGIKDALLQYVAEAFQNRERPDFSAADRAIWPWVAVRFDR
jgi:uncharacterized phiE125 gp8 family phage protein